MLDSYLVRKLYFERTTWLACNNLRSLESFPWEIRKLLFNRKGKDVDNLEIKNTPFYWIIPFESSDCLRVYKRAGLIGEIAVLRTVYTSVSPSCHEHAYINKYDLLKKKFINVPYTPP